MNVPLQGRCHNLCEYCLQLPDLPHLALYFVIISPSHYDNVSMSITCNLFISLMLKYNSPLPTISANGFDAKVKLRVPFFAFSLCNFIFSQFLSHAAFLRSSICS